MPAPATSATPVAAPTPAPPDPTPQTELQAVLAAVTASRSEASSQFTTLGSALEHTRNILENTAAAVAGLQTAQDATDQRVRALAEHQNEAAMRIETLEQRVSQLADPARAQPVHDERFDELSRRLRAIETNATPAPRTSLPLAGDWTPWRVHLVHGDTHHRMFRAVPPPRKEASSLDDPGCSTLTSPTPPLSGHSRPHTFRETQCWRRQRPDRRHSGSRPASGSSTCS